MPATYSPIPAPAFADREPKQSSFAFAVYSSARTPAFVAVP